MSYRKITVAVCVSLGMGCFKKPPDRAHWDVPPVVNCTSSYAWPVFDIGVATPLYAGLAYANANGDINWGVSDDPNVNALVHAIGAVLLLGTGIYTAKKVKQCRNYKAYVSEHEPRLEVETTPTESIEPVGVDEATPPPTLPAPVFQGCVMDTDCKGDRICEDGRCQSAPVDAQPQP